MRASSTVEYRRSASGSKDPRYPDVSGSYPNSDRIASQGLYLPSSLSLGEAELARVAEALAACHA